MVRGRPVTKSHGPSVWSSSDESDESEELSLMGAKDTDLPLWSDLELSEAEGASEGLATDGAGCEALPHFPPRAAGVVPGLAGRFGDGQ